MIISMRPHATREEIDHVRERIAEFGYRVHSIDGEERVVRCPERFSSWREGSAALRTGRGTGGPNRRSP